MELDALELMDLYSNMESCSEEVAMGAMEDFAEIVADNDLMDVWDKKHPRPHPFTVTTSLPDLGEE